MDKNKRQIMILAVVILAFVVFLLAAAMKPKPARKPAAQAPGAAVNAVANKPAEALSPGKSSFPSWGRDPFAVGSVPVQATGDLSLSGIFWDAKKPVCLIDGKMLKAGDEISGAKVLEINKDTVLLKVGDELRTLRVGR
ncbi:MAG: hypothetical protein PHE80_05250 [Candidatus Omnitrophica bacterium]|nr:hypothetical protein [Candidatus Omnitrophota bacterium]MDD5737665.1 hypothetical protein [Candidatus Omnitrophota bacterium]